MLSFVKEKVGMGSYMLRHVWEDGEKNGALEREGDGFFHSPPPHTL